MVCDGDRCSWGVLSAIVAVLICLLLDHVLPAADSRSSNRLVSKLRMLLPSPPRSLPVRTSAHHAPATPAAPARLPPHAVRWPRGLRLLASLLEFCVAHRFRYP